MGEREGWREVVGRCGVDGVARWRGGKLGGGGVQQVF